ncbi:cysteine proteinase [Rhizophagus clarus]|uniref:Cysteine proteinase n=1 Tax=Rhizophagus clarus TaxID=94130 RepID=A0A8H3L2V5_9GLOM|nr:cysteine proteinase [Rhizophagus clarus]
MKRVAKYIDKELSVMNLAVSYNKIRRCRNDDESLMYDDAYDIIEKQVDSFLNKEHDENMLLVMFQAEEISSYIVYYLQLITAAYFKLYCEEYEPFF